MKLFVTFFPYYLFNIKTALLSFSLEIKDRFLYRKGDGLSFLEYKSYCIYCSLGAAIHTMSWPFSAQH